MIGEKWGIYYGRNRNKSPIFHKIHVGQTPVLGGLWGRENHAGVTRFPRSSTIQIPAPAQVGVSHA